MILTYKNDPLLFNESDEKKFVTINNLKNKNLLFLDKGVLNLYSALVKSIDFKKFHLNSISYCKIKTDIIKKYLNKKFIKKDFLRLRRLLAKYCCKKKIKIENIRTWEKYNVWPLIVLRIIATLNKDELGCLSKLLLKVNGFINLNKGTLTKFPLKLKDLLTKKNAYLAGAILGDGGFCLTNCWTIVDGGKPEEIKDSYDYLIKIKDLFTRLYQIDYIRLRQRQNKVELIINRRDFGRFLNFFFGVPYGKKKNRIQKPIIFKYSLKRDELYKCFWRGMFDTDGHCDKKQNSISFNSGTLKLAKECADDLRSFSILSTNITGNLSYNVYIKSENYNLFAERIGFSHPRKKRNLLNRLKIGSREIKLIGFNYKNLYESFFDLRKIKNLRIYGVENIIKDIRKIYGFRKIFCKKVNASIAEVFGWERGRGIPFIKLYRLWLLHKGSLDSLYKWLNKNHNKVRYGLSGRGDLSCLVKLPVVVNRDILDIAKYLIPYQCEIRLRKGGDNKGFIKRFEVIFNSKILKRRKPVKNNLSKTILRFLKTFFIYNKQWLPYSNNQIKNLNNRLESIWD